MRNPCRSRAGPWEGGSSTRGGGLCPLHLNLFTDVLEKCLGAELGGPRMPEPVIKGDWERRGGGSSQMGPHPARDGGVIASGWRWCAYP